MPPTRPNNMFELAQTTASDMIHNLQKEPLAIRSIEPSSLPASFSLSELITYVADEKTTDKEAKLRQVLVTWSCLKSSKMVSQEQDNASISQLSLWLSEAILPSPFLVSHGDGSPDIASRDKAALLAQQKGIIGLQALQILLNIQSPPPSALESRILLSLIAFTSTRDPWTSPLSVSIATSILTQFSTQAHSKDFIVDNVLQVFIRPLFSGSKPETVTESGRKAMPSSAPPKRFDAKSEYERTKPSIVDTPYTLAVFEWAIANSTKEIASSYFNLYVPPLLTLLDSTATPIRARALIALSTFIPLLHPTLLNQTGLGEVFEEAITPTLMFLPSITPVEESVQLLEPAYHALTILGKTLYPSQALQNKAEKEESKDSVSKTEAQEMKFWDRVMRKGVLMGYAHAHEHPEIVEILLKNLGNVVEVMKIHAVVHLKDVIPILTTTLTDPFGASHSGVVLAGLVALQRVILNCWPRVVEPEYRIDIVSALVLSWKWTRSYGDSESDILDRIESEIFVAGKLLVAAISSNEGAREDFSKDLRRLLAEDESLANIFGRVVDSQGRTAESDR